MNHKRYAPVLVSLASLVVATLACGPLGGGKPTITIIAPPNGAQVGTGQTVEVQFRAEDEKAVIWVQMTVNGDVVTTQQAPLAEGQTPLEGILRWTPGQAGTFNLVLTAHNSSGQDSDPAAVSIIVVEATADMPTPTPIPTPRPQPGQPTPTPRPGQPTATPRPSQPTNTPRPGQPTNAPPPTNTPPPPTNTPQPTNTPIPTPGQPTIVTFESDAYTLQLGGTTCATLHWVVQNADSVYLEYLGLTTSVANPEGWETYCYHDLSEGPNTITLQAENAAGGMIQPLTIVVETPQEVAAAYMPDMSGNVSQNGDVEGASFFQLNPRDDFDDTSWSSFATFSLLDIPSGAHILSAELDMGSCSTAGSPFADLGEILVNYYYYGDLDLDDYYDSYWGDYLGSITDCSGSGFIDVTDSVQAHIADAYYQIAFYFDVSTDNDSDEDGAMFSNPELWIAYTTP